MRAPDVVRTALGVTAICWPEGPSRLVGAAGDPRVETVVRILGARWLLQVAGGALAGRRKIDAKRRIGLVDAAVETGHGATMLLLAARSTRYRRSAAMGAATAFAFAAADSASVVREGRRRAR